MSGRVHGKVCVVTGAASGIGHATAARLAGEGGRVAIADIDEEGARRAAAGIPDAAAFPLDVTDPESVAGLYDAVAARFGRIDVCVNNAGILIHEDADPIATGLDVWNRIMAVNLTGVFLCLKYQLPHLLRDGGSIVNLASFVAVMGSATPQTAYDTSKGGVLTLSRNVAVTYARRGIRCNAICPGPIETPLFREIFGRDEAAAERRLVHVPAGRFGRPEEVANAILYLASDESSWTTGTTFMVDGGITAAYTTPVA